MRLNRDFEYSLKSSYFFQVIRGDYFHSIDRIKIVQYRDKNETVDTPA